MPKLTLVQPDTKYPRSIETIDLDKLRFKVKHVTRLKDGDHHLEHEVDLSKMDKEVLLKHAVMDIIIKYRSRSFKKWTSKELEKKFSNGFVFKPEDYPAKSGGGAMSAESRITGGVNQIGKESKTKAEAVARYMTMMPGIDKKVAEAIVAANHPNLK